MKDVKTVVLEKAVRLLDSLKLDYVIINPDGENIVKGEIEIQDKKRKRQRGSLPYGTYSALFKSHGVDNMEIGDVIAIPCGSFDPVTIRKTVSAHAANRWGGGSAISSINGNFVEVMRIDNGK